MFDLAQTIGETLTELSNSGFRYPIRVAALAVNGAATVLSFDEDGGAHFTLEPAGNFTLPVNFMFVDARGEAARLVIETGCTTRRLS